MFPCVLKDKILYYALEAMEDYYRNYKSLQSETHYLSALGQTRFVIYVFHQN